MPPLVDNPNPSLTYTFYSEMTPLSFPTTNAPTPTQSSAFSNPPSPLTPDESVTPHFLPMSHTRSHGKRRDPSYIPRPSNAFILFRSAFIRDRKVSDKVEGNHSSLSKIIGHSWKKLSPDEREKWEAEAVAAQAQHRAMYPDWRFRPGANALAKLKIKDGGTTTTRRRSARVKDPPDDAADDGIVDADQGGKGKEKGKVKNKSTRRMFSLEEMRCAKIADFVADGIRGEELEVAVKQWEGDRKMGKERSQRPRLSRTRGVSSASAHARSHSYTTPTIGSSSMSDNQYPNNPSSDSTSNPPQNSQVLIDATKPVPLDNRGPLPSGVPLTHMFKRSLSAPASHTDLPAGPMSPSDPSDDSSADDVSPYATAEPRSGSWDNYSPLMMQVSPTGTHSHVHDERRDSISFPMPSGANTSATNFDGVPQQQHLTWQDAENQRRIEEMQEPNSWWGDSRSAEVESSTFGYHGCTEHNGTRSVTDMGYENSSASHFDSGYVEYGSFESPHDGSQNVEWTDMSNNTDRCGLATVLGNSYKDGGNPNSPHTLTPPTIYAPPLSSSYYYTQDPVPAPQSPLPPSSFSTLTGWAGDYKVQPNAWPDTPAPPSSSSPTSSSHWYSPDGTFHWGGGRFEHGHCPSLDSQDWDRLEYRAASDLHLAVEPLRPMTFQDEIRRLQGGSS
ncbi:hypothetical protein BYT27DRAFT_7224879 [Phlegmacium glaucopus]|nr:hypothetical protein BYT27DRAFT_7224879 [Phlegmacium glaucopus]